MLSSNEGVYIEEISCKGLAKGFAEKTIGDWAIRRTTGANIIGLKTSDNSYIVNPSPQVKISANDQIFVLGNPEQIDNLKKVLFNN